MYESICPNWLSVNCIEMDTCKDFHLKCDQSEPECKRRTKMWNLMIGGNHPGVLENHPSFTEMYMCSGNEFIDSDACEGDSGGNYRFSYIYF